MQPSRNKNHVRALRSALVAMVLAASSLLAQPAPGDFKVGDRIMLFVQGEKALTDSFTVMAGPAIDLPVVGALSLAGVRQADLQSYLTKAIAKYFVDPVVRVKVRNQMRLGVLGAVGKPNYYLLSSESVLSDLLTLGGGPSGDAKLKSTHIDRAGETLIEADSVRKLFTSNATLSDLGLQSGDELIVPRSGGAMRTLSVIGTIVAIPASLYWLFLRR